MPTSANPFIPAPEIEAARRELPERVFAQEFLAQFLEDGGTVFRNVSACANATQQEQGVAGHQYIIGADWGRDEDFTVFSVFDLTARAQVKLDRSNQIEYAQQRARLVELCRAFNPVAVVAEQNSIGTPIIEALVREGIPVRPFTTTNASKAAIVDSLALAFEQKSISILNDPIQIGELQVFRGQRLPSGLIRYAAPAGFHDDTVIALCLAHDSREIYGQSEQGEALW